MTLLKKLCLVATSLFVSHVSLLATTLTWNGSASGDWSNAANWTPAGPPGSGDTANITNGTVVISNAATCGKFRGQTVLM